jgi:hypothetical protein
MCSVTGEFAHGWPQRKGRKSCQGLTMPAVMVLCGNLFGDAED